MRLLDAFFPETKERQRLFSRRHMTRQDLAANMPFGGRKFGDFFSEIVERPSDAILRLGHKPSNITAPQ